jgi:hypothetical protein
MCSRAFHGYALDTVSSRSRAMTECWVSRIVLPVLIAVLTLSLFEIWSPVPYRNEWADIIGSGGLLLGLLGLSAWCFSAWIAKPTR